MEAIILLFGMKPITLFFCAGIIILGLWVARVLYDEWKEGRKPTPSDLLFDLKFKVECSIINSHSESYLQRRFEELNDRKDINKEQLHVLYGQFLRRFAILHKNHEHKEIEIKEEEIDEFSPENLN